MSINWNDLSVLQKRISIVSMIVTGLVTIGGVLWAGGSLLATDKEVDAKVAKVQTELERHMEAQVLADNRSAIQDAKTAIRQINFQLLDEGLPEIKRRFLEQSKEELQELIRCVQEGKSLCE